MELLLPDDEIRRRLIAATKASMEQHGVSSDSYYAETFMQEVQRTIDDALAGRPT